MGYVDIEIVADSNGSIKMTVLGHGDGASCMSEKDNALLLDLLNTDIEGFGDMLVPSEDGRTPEYYEEKRQASGQPAGIPTTDQVSPFKGVKPKVYHKSKDLGYSS